MELIEAYIVEIGKHLPGKDRADVQQEIRSLLQDALDKFALILAQFVRGDARLLVCGLLVVMSLLAYLICRPRKTKLAQQIVWQRKEER